MRELVVISGKGGTGKTSIAASFAILARNPVIADCDVDAADMHLLLSPVVLEKHDFLSGNEAVIREDECVGCGECADRCRFGAISPTGSGSYRIDPGSCEGCGVCVRACHAQAIDFPERLCGEWMISRTRAGPMVHARLHAAAENSGKLVSLVRREARRLAEESGTRIIIVDGPPGIGCPVIASLTSATDVLAVTEPTVSGEHDLERVLSLARHFGIRAAVCVNKWDINPDMTARIEEKARESGASLSGRVRYDSAVTAAQIEAKTVIETDSPAAQDVRAVWRSIGLMED